MLPRRIKFWVHWIFLITTLTGCLPKAGTIPLTQNSAQTSPASMPDPSAFPGAEGFGTETPGGRFGRVIAVTNLNDTTDPNSSDYHGSLRWALEQTWPDDPDDPYDQRRIIIFKVGGEIKLEDVLYVQHPFVTIAGQSAPGDGITLRREQFTIATHDVVLRGMRFRVGDEGGYTCCRDGLNISTTAADSDIYNVVIDHCSISWGIDENISTHVDPEKNYRMHDVTIQWSIISEGLHHSIHVDEGASDVDAHSMGMLLGEDGSNVTIHHNLFAHNWGRNPRVSGIDQLEIVNNLIYGWDNAAIEFSDDRSTVQIVKNYFKANDDSRPFEINLHEPMNPDSQVYLEGNVSDDDRSKRGLEAVRIKNLETFELASAPLFTSKLIVTSPEDVYQDVLDRAGVTWPIRDAVDRRIVKQVKKRSGKIIDSEVQVGGWPNYENGSYPTDTDDDGIPDDWEISHGLDPNDASDASSARKISPNGFSWIEEYMNSLFP